MRTASRWMFGAVFALLAGPLWGQGGLSASVATMPAPTRVHFDMTATPPVLTPEQLARRDRGPLPHATPLPEGVSAVARPDSLPAGATDAGAGTKAVPGTFTLFTNTSLGATIKANTSGLTGEPTLANSGPIVFATGNWWAAISSDGGQNFSFISPYTQFPASFGGFCCDQMAVYDPSRDIFIWTLQYSSSGPAGGGQNLFRVAVARPSDAVQGNWWYYDFNSAVNTEWDFPGLCLSNDFAYYFTNRGTFNSGSVNDSFLFRFPLDPLSIAAGFSYNSIDFGANGIGNLSWRCANGSRDILYFAAHNTTSQVRIMRWAENSGSLFWDDVNLSVAWPNATRACPTPDGRDWCGFDDGRIKAGWVGRNKIGFLWNASAGSGFLVPYVEGVRVVESTRAYLDRPLMWNSTLAFQYPAAAVNARGDVGVGVHASSSSTYPAFLLGIDDDFSRDAGFGPPGWELVYARIGTQGPNTNRWGDYFSVQPSMPGGLGWTATGTTMQGCGGAGCKETRYVLFGRERDMRGIADPPVIYSASGTTFVAGTFGTFAAMASGFPIWRWWERGRPGSRSTRRRAYCPARPARELAACIR